MRRKARGRDEGREGQGEVIEVSVRLVELSRLDVSEELLQSGFWGWFKQAHGWKPIAFSVEVRGVRVPAAFGLLVLVRGLARVFSIAYAPFGPSLDPETDRAEMLSSLARAVRAHLPKTVLFLRFDLPWQRSGEAPGGARLRPRLVKSASDMQPASTVIVDLVPDLDRVLASMKSKTRYNIRLAEKKGIELREAGAADFDAWYALYEETARRDSIAIHSRAYYQGLLEGSSAYPGARPIVKLLLAAHEGDLLAGNIVAFWRSRAAYLYGASSGHKRNLMPTYALQWHAMRMAKAAGCATYDLYGVPPTPDPGHAMHGLYQFKTGFSQGVLERWGTWDAPYRPGLYAGYRAAEALRMLWHRGLKKRLRRRFRADA
jgi:lipid II:glycine glycyltransferase (peptidoglycan interpeptide bridge formation enzyme)